MKRTSSRWMRMGALVALGLAGCPLDPVPGGDGGVVSDARMVGGDGGACAGRALCEAVGTRCDGDALVTCAPDADGCLVETRSACDGVEGGACASPAGTAMCVVDACAAIPASERCDTASRSCEGTTLSICAPNAEGCLVRTDTDCAVVSEGTCDASGAMPVCTTPVDPCAGVTQCGTEETRTCSGASLVTCAPDAFGCFVTTSTSCALDGLVCDASAGSASCVDPCTLVTTCAAESYCDGASTVRCARDTNGCLVETARTACDVGTACGVVGGAAACTDVACPGAQPRVLDCASGTVTADVAVAPTDVRDAYCGNGWTYPAPEHLYRFVHHGSGRVAVHVTATRNPLSLADSDLYVLDAGDGTASCSDASLPCLAQGATSNPVESVDFAVDPGDSAYLAYDLYALTSWSAPTDYTLAITCTPVACGDGRIDAGEDCEDGNTASGDGCSASCTTELGYVCTGTPSVCRVTCGDGVLDARETCDDANVASGDGCSSVCAVESGYACVGVGPGSCVTLDANASCASATPITAPMTISGVNLAAGGPREPDSATCGSGTGASVHYYAVTVPAGQRAVVRTTPTADVLLFVAASCSATSCVSFTDLQPEQTTLDNGAGTTPLTRIVGIRPYMAGTAGSYAVSFEYSACGDGVIDGGEECDDGDRGSGDGCSASCVVEGGFVCTGSPTVCEAGPGVCASARVVTSTHTFTGENLAMGGPLLAGVPSGDTSCGNGTGSKAIYYAVTVPAGREVRVAVTPSGFDAVIFRATGCDATSCEARADAGGLGVAESMVFVNEGTTDRTELVGVRPYSGSTGTYAVAFTYATPPYVVRSIAASCFDLTAISPSLSFVDDEVTTTTALPFAMPFFGATATHYALSSNGNVQLFTSSSGSAWDAWTNTSIPNATSPNGLVAPLWDDLRSVSVREATIGGDLVVEWTGTVASVGVRVQSVLTSSGVIEFHYCTLPTGSASGATIGLESVDGTAGTLIGFDSASAAVTGAGYRLTPS